MELGVVTADSHGVIKSVNQHACKMFGYAKEDLLHKKINVLMPSPYSEQHDAYLHRYETTRKARLLGTCRVVEGKRSNGEVFSLRLSLSKIETEEEGIIWVSLFDPVKDNQIVLSLDADGEFIVAVSGHPEILGHSHSSLVGQSIRILIPTGLQHSHQSPNLETKSSSSTEKHPTLTLNRPRNFLAVHKNGRDSHLMSVVLKEKTIMSRDGGNGSSPSVTKHITETTPTPMHIDSQQRCPYARLSESGGAPLERSPILAVLTPIERDLEAMATIDDRGVVRSCNSNFLTLFGYSQEEMIGRSIGSLMSEVALPVLKAIAKEKAMTDDQRRIIGKGFHAALGLHRDFTVFPMKFAVDELYHHTNVASHPLPSSGIPSPPSSQIDLPSVTKSSGSEEAHPPQHSVSVLPPSVLYQCTIQRLRPDEEQDLVSMLAETYEDLKDEHHPTKQQSQEGKAMTDEERDSLQKKAKKQDKPATPIGDSPTTRRQQQQGVSAGAYTYDITLGGGYFGKVKLALHRLTGEKVAIKTLRKRQYENIKMAYPPRELKLMMKLNHPNIYKLLEVVELEDRILMITEFCTGGELFDYMAKKDHFDDKESRRLFRQLVSAVDYMHLNGICHRDLKLENLLLDEGNNIKIIDLGLGNFFDKQRLLDSFCGTADYASPELWQGKRYVGPEVDIWSMGVLLFVFLTGKMPFLSPRHAVMGDFFFPSSPPVSESAKSLIRRMLVANSSQRATMEEVRNHPWVTLEDGTPPPRLFLKRLSDLDKDVIKQMVDLLGFEEQSIVSSLNHNDFNQFTTTYQLLLDKKNRLKSKQQKYNSSLSKGTPTILLPTTSNPALPANAGTVPPSSDKKEQKDSSSSEERHHEGLCLIS